MNDHDLKIQFSSKNKNWETPQSLFNQYNEIYNFTYDLAADKFNKKCKFYFSKKDNSLTKDWHKIKGWLWLNPPYGRDVIKWVEKSHNEALKGAKIIMLIFAKTDTKYFHNYIYNKYEIEFLKGRLKFGNSKNNAPYGNMIVKFEVI
jgi:site-specific DNA-methyltransferase (adenine-specific)